MKKSKMFSKIKIALAFIFLVSISLQSCKKVDLRPNENSSSVKGPFPPTPPPPVI